MTCVETTPARAWFKFPGLVPIYAWLSKGTGCYFVFDRLSDDVEAFFGDLAKTKCWLENGRWWLSSTNFGPTQIKRLKAFEDPWDKVSNRLKVEA